MKNINIIPCFLIFLTASVYLQAQPTGSEEFEKIHAIIKSAIPEGFVLNSRETSDTRSQYTFTYDLNGAGLNSLIYTVRPKTTEFSAIDFAMGGVQFNIQDRKAMFVDGSNTGVSSISVILKNGKGLLSVSHREISDMSPYSRDKLEEVISKISFEQLEEGLN